MTRAVKPSFTTTRCRYLFFISTLCGSSFLILTFNNSQEALVTNYIWNTLPNVSVNNISADYRNQFTIKTEGCLIPSMKPFDESILKFINIPKNIEKCQKSNFTLLKSNKTHIWIRKEAVPQHVKNMNNTTINCCYQAFYRPTMIEDVNSGADNRVKYEKCVNFTQAVKVKHEFVRVTCDNLKKVYSQFFLFAPKKPFSVHNNKKEIPKNKTAYNILVLGIDSVSRLNFYRTMPKTIKYLKSKGAIDLAGYNKVGDNTFPNLIPMLLGVTPNELTKICLPYKSATFDNCPFIWEWYKQAGYYTALAEDSSWLGTFNYLRQGFLKKPTDYYIHTFINEAERKARRDRKSSICMSDRHFYKVLLDYTEDVTRTLNSTRLFGFFWEITMSHDYLNHARILDDDYESFFKRLDSSNYLNESIILLVSDHGIRWGPIRSTKQGRLEERLPFVFLLVPQSFRDKYSVAFNNVKINSERLTTPFNIHATLIDLLDLESIQNEKIISRSMESYGNLRNISLFLPIPSNRTCQMAGIADHWCTCHRDVTISKSSIEVIEGSAHLVRFLNKLLNEYPKCAPLRLKEVLEASEMITGKPEKNEVGWREFMLVIRTEPGDGEFEATLRYNSRQWAVAGTVSRLNQYGEQSKCVEDNLLKLYCYCT